MAKRTVKTVQKRNVGRPEHVPNQKSRQVVEQCVSTGMSHRDIARVLGISWKTLLKYYEDELLNGKARKQQEIMAMLYRSARQGNVSAQRKLYAIAYGEDGIPVGDEVLDRPKKLGKKEQLQHDADNVSETYAPPEPPKLVVNNTR